MTTEEMITVMQHYALGGDIEVSSKCVAGSPIWTSHIRDTQNPANQPTWNWCHFDYRVKRAPRDFWVYIGQYDETKSQVTANNPRNNQYIHVREVIE